MTPDDAPPNADWLSRSTHEPTPFLIPIGSADVDVDVNTLPGVISTEYMVARQARPTNRFLHA